MTSDNLSTLFTLDPNAPKAVGIGQGIVQSWNSTTGENSIQWGNGVLENLPSLTAESAELVAGDVVALLSSGDRMLVLGKVTTPGDPGTVPTWNADLTALAPLTDLAAATTGLTIQGATNVTTPDINGAHVVVNDPAYPGQVALYSGNPSEVDPGLVKPSLGAANYGVLEFRSPDLVGSGAYAYVLMEGYDDGHTNLTASADNFRFEGNTTFTLINWAGPVQIGDGTDFVTVDGKVVTNANLTDPTNTLVTDSGWVDLTPSAGWAHSAYTGVAKAQCRKIGNRVHFRGSLSGTSLAVNTTTAIATVPAGYFNGLLRNFRSLGTTGGFLGWANVTDTGVLQVNFKSPWTTAAAVIDVSGMSYLMD